ncbi:hypothetical protein AAFC00_002583 [Neodothiora populina]|uniref:Small ribosomal subunit protein mS23 n=1 Tax=Neodothiora populina TaxID=2781224 RepID=A0ABR3P7V6_9PEZI
MGRYNLSAQRVHQTATRMLETKKLTVPPPWYDVVANLPPSQRLVRPALQGARKQGKKASKLFQPVKIAYEEDNLRADFFGDHPWELARPRQVLEDDGKDYQRYNWSKLEQPGKQIDGESVVQRQRWLMGMIRHDLDFPCSPELRAYLRSEQFQQERALFKQEYNVDLDCAVPSEGLDTSADMTVSVQLTYHPETTHDFNAGKKHMAKLLSDKGVRSNMINRRSFDVAFPATQKLIDSLSATDFSPILKTYQIAVSLGEPLKLTTSSQQGSNDSTEKQLQTLTFSYNRNFTPSLSSAIASIASSLSIPVSTLIHRPLPLPDPDTFNLYSKAHAYDTARKEFYAVRHKQDIQRRVAREEALFVGAEFGPNALEVGMALEDQKFEEWKVWAVKEIAQQKQLSGSAYAGNLAEEEDTSSAPIASSGDVVASLDDAETRAGIDEVADSLPASRKGQEALGGAVVHP